MNDSELDPNVAFALLLETASEQFGVLYSLIVRKLEIRNGTGSDSASIHLDITRAQACIQMALAKEFLFNARRSLRICLDFSCELNIDKERRENYGIELEQVTGIRNVNEHGYDPKPRKKSQRSMHTHDLEKISLDETCLIVLGPDKIFMGPLNLVEISNSIETMRGVAGFTSLKEQIATTVGVLKKSPTDNSVPDG